MQDSRTGGLPLSSFLLKPMQRVTKYPLLIKRVSYVMLLKIPVVTLHTSDHIVTKDTSDYITYQ